MSPQERAVPAPRAVERAVDATALIAGYALLGLALLMTVEIIGRKLFNWSLQGVDELGGYALALAAGLGFAPAALARSHTRVDLLLKYLRPALRGLAHVLAYVLLAGVAVFLAWYGWRSLQDTLLFGSVANSPLQTPLWIPQSLFLLGLLTFVAITAIMAVRIVRLWLAGRYEVIDREFGSLSVAEEIEESGAVEALEIPRGPVR